MIRALLCETASPIFKIIKMPYKLLFALMALTTALHAQAPVIQSITPLANSVEQWGKFEARIVLSATFTNPYDYDQIRVTAVFTAPNGTQTSVEGFYMDDYNLNTVSGNLSANSSGNGFRLRFSPRQAGQWSYTVSCTTAQGTGVAAPQTFTCTPANAPQNKGFVKPGASNFLEFENGEQYIPVGENIAWQNANPYLDFSKWVGKMADNKGNFFRFWLCHWGLGLEWKNGYDGYQGLRRYKQSSAYYMDWLFDYSAARGVYLMFCINHHGQVSSQVNPNWSDSPYNAANGGMCANTWDFFSNTAAKNAHKNRLRYILARWGYARSVMTWELFNEVNWTDNFAQNKPAIAAWHAEMAAFLKTNDPYGRPVSTSFGSDESEMPEIWNNPDMDYTQRHYYLDSPNLEAVLAGGARENLEAYDKPTLIGEFGLGTTGSGLSSLDPNGIYIHNSLWGGLYGGGLGSAMSWWWDSYIEPANLYTHFYGISEIADKTPFVTQDMHPTDASVGGAPADLRLDPSLEWSGLGDTLIRIDATGQIQPAGFKLSRYLYGAQWNTQFRRPPVFEVDMPQAGKFRLRTGGQFATAPKLVIWLDGQKLLETTPAVNTNYEITVPAGIHRVKVDNAGTDWMLVSAYTFEGLGSAVDAYVLKSADKQQLAGWLLNANYNHVYVKANGAPQSVQGAFLKVPDMANGNYQLKWFNCQSGELLQSESLSVQNGQLLAPLPELIWDLAFSLETLSVGTSAPTAAQLPLELFPNPAPAGTTLRIAIETEMTQALKVELLNAGGLSVQTLQEDILPAGKHQLFLPLGTHLPAGLYWVMVQSGAKRSVRAIGVVAP